MGDKLGILAKEENPINKGIIISAIVVLAGLIPNVELSWIKILPTDSWLLILGGLSSFFYFVSIKVNQTESIDERGIAWTKTPVFKSELCKEFQRITIFILVLFVLRGGFLILLRII